MTMTVGELFIALVIIALVLLMSNALRLGLPGFDDCFFLAR
ncbi:hypothetical protein P4544_03520 [Halomonas sp. LY9]